MIPQTDKSFFLLFFKKEVLFFLSYLLFVLPTLAYVTPPWQNPDEPSHMLRAVQIAHGGLLGYRAWGSAGGDSDPSIYTAYTPLLGVAMHPERRVTRAALAASGNVGWRRDTIYTPFPNTAQYGPAFYLPDAASYWAGRAAGLSINHTLYVARAANSLVFALLAAAALAMARRARAPLAAILLLPTTLSLAASASQDSLLLACTAVVVAMLDRAIAAGRAATPREIWLLAILLACIGMARPPYAGFLLVLLLGAPPPQRARLAPAAVAAAAIIAWCLAVVGRVSIHLGGSDIGRQVALLAADPGRVPAIILATAHAYAVPYAVQFIGVLGWTDTRLPHAYVIFAALVLVLAFLAGTSGPARRPWAPCAAALFATAAIFILQYLTWTWPGQPVVTGVLGRYFLPIAMVLALALPRLNVRLGAIIRPALLTQAAITPAIMLHAIMLRYYHGS